MNIARSRRCRGGALSLLLLLALAGCSAASTNPVGVHSTGTPTTPPPPPPPPPATGLTVSPVEVWLATQAAQTFAASASSVQWSLSGTGTLGTISAAGAYRAPDAPVNLYVVATEPSSGMSGYATVHVVSATGTHGLDIPATHPRLFFTASNLAAARAWFAGHGFTPDGSYELETALVGLLGNNATQCRNAISSALTKTQSMPRSGTACDDCRWNGERAIVVFDWCYDYMTAQERSTFITSTNAWINYWRTQPWGAPPGHQGNYYWGYLRNELEWAIASYHENTAPGCGSATQSCPEVLLEHVFTTRLRNDFYPAWSAADTAQISSGRTRGGVTLEGTSYGTYMSGYAQLPWGASRALGRDLYTENGFWLENVYYNIYATSPATTYRPDGSSMCFNQFPFGDDQNWRDGCTWYSPTWRGDTWPGNTMLGAAARWPTQPVGRHARQWLATTGASADYYLQALDPGGTPLAFSSLPLDYYARGSLYAWARSSWSANATSVFLQMGDPGGRVNHPHNDWGSFQIWRGGRYLSRESVSYGDPIAGYGGAGTANGAYEALAHNAVLFNGIGTQKDFASSADNAVMNRLESRPGYLFAAIDLTRTYLDEYHSWDSRWANPQIGSAGGPVGNWVREFVFVRDLETLVVLDRLKTASANATRTFINHCGVAFSISGRTSTCTFGGQSLVTTTAWPTTGVTLRNVAEGGVGQHRLEVDTAPGTQESYMIHVLQAKDSGAAALAPTATDNGSTFTVTLDGTHSITFQKGMASGGGYVTLPGGATSFRAGIQSISVSEDGPAWGP